MPQKDQRGAALMELMVGITIGLLVVVAAIGSLVFTRTASTTMVDSTNLQQKADGFFRLIRFQLPQAGGITLDPIGLDVAAAAAQDGRVSFDTRYLGYYLQTGTDGVGAPFLSVHGTDRGNTAGAAGADTLRISTQDDKTTPTALMRDCTGARPPPALDGISINNQYSLPNPNPNFVLNCTAPTISGLNTQPVLDGVEDFQVTYGVFNPAANTFQYLTAAAVTNWQLVSTVNICLQLRGELAGNPQPGMAAIVGCRPPATVANDGRIRRVYNRTFSLRNALS